MDPHMNVFVLSTGRCGSTTFIKACGHITNYTSAHESRICALGAARTGYPPRHIEADNRLIWFLGRLDSAYGDAPLFVHLTRDHQAVARSHVNRYYYGITKAYREAILSELPESADPMAVAMDYVHTVNSNIEYFLRGKPHVMAFRLERAEEDFRIFWDRIGAEGDLVSALSEFRVRHNATPAPRRNMLLRGWDKLVRVGRGLPKFLRTA
jgi:hypothetical protein